MSGRWPRFAPAFWALTWDRHTLTPHPRPARAIGGNAFSGATDLIQSFRSGEGGGHSVFYSVAQSVASGPSQGFGSALGKSAEGTPWTSGPADVATTALLTN